MKIISHRGDRRFGAENSRAAILEASKKANLVEIDIQITKDNRFICFHDDRSTRVRKKLIDLGQPHAASLPDDYLYKINLETLQKHLNIDLLENVLKEDLQCPLMLDVKPSCARQIDDLVKIINENKQKIKYVCSHNILSLLYLSENLDKDIHCGLIYFGGPVSDNLKNLLLFSKISFLNIKKQRFKQAKQQELIDKMQTFVYTVNSFSDASYFEKQGVSGIITDRI